MDIPFVNLVDSPVKVAPTHNQWTSNEWAPLPHGRGNLRLAFLGLIPALKCFGGGRRSRAGLKAAVKVTEETVEKPRWKAKRLRKPTGALRKWGGVGFKIRQDGLALRPQVFQEEQATKVKWKPKRENWQAWVTDDEGTEAFGPLAVGHEVMTSLRLGELRTWGPATMITQPWPDALALEWTLKSTGFDSVELRNAALKNWLRTGRRGKDVLVTILFAIRCGEE
eukprot:s107_g3.t1